MGSSWRSDLNDGRLPDMEAELRKGLEHIKTALRWSLQWEPDQYDNAADDGIFQERLRIAIELIEEELPKKTAKQTTEG